MNPCVLHYAVHSAKKPSPRVQAELLALARVSVAGALGREKGLRRQLSAALRLPVSSDRLHEALLQLVPFAGFARAINAFRALRELSPGRVFLRDRGSRGRRRRGTVLCRRIYGSAYGRLLRRMNEYHPDLADWMLEDGYGKVLSRPGLTLRQRELLIVPVLAALQLPLQLDSHVRGAMRVGATRAEIAGVLRACGLTGSEAIVRSGGVPSDRGLRATGRSSNSTLRSRKSRGSGARRRRARSRS